MQEERQCQGWAAEDRLAELVEDRLAQSLEDRLAEAAEDRLAEVEEGCLFCSLNLNRS